MWREQVRETLSTEGAPEVQQEWRSDVRQHRHRRLEERGVDRRSAQGPRSMKVGRGPDRSVWATTFFVPAPVLGIGSSMPSIAHSHCAKYGNRLYRRKSPPGAGRSASVRRSCVMQQSKGHTRLEAAGYALAFELFFEAERAFALLRSTSGESEVVPYRLMPSSPDSLTVDTCTSSSSAGISRLVRRSGRSLRRASGAVIRDSSTRTGPVMPVSTRSARALSQTTFACSPRAATEGSPRSLVRRCPRRCGSRRTGARELSP